jgi:hypothetical protein
MNENTCEEMPKEARKETESDVNKHWLKGK